MVFGNSRYIIYGSFRDILLFVGVSIDEYDVGWVVVVLFVFFS